MATACRELRTRFRCFERQGHVKHSRDVLNEYSLLAFLPCIKMLIKNLSTSLDISESDTHCIFQAFVIEINMVISERT